MSQSFKNILDNSDHVQNKIQLATERNSDETSINKVLIDQLEES